MLHQTTGPTSPVPPVGATTPVPSVNVDHGPLLTQPMATVIGGVCVLLAGVLAFVVASYNRRQNELHWRATNRQTRYTSAVEKLAEQSPELRIAGVYALESLIDDWLRPTKIPLDFYLTWSRLRYVTRRGWRRFVRDKYMRDGAIQAQACVDVLCSYLRLQHLPSPDGQTAIRRTITAQRSDNTHIEVEHLYKQGDVEVRASIVNVMASHLREERRNKSQMSWQQLSFDLSGVEFFSLVDFTDCNFFASSFRSAKFYQPTAFVRARLTAVDFGAATFYAESDFEDAVVGDSYFDNTVFRGPTNFDLMTAVDWAYFSFARFLGNLTMRKVRYGKINFRDAEFTNSELSFDPIDLTSAHPEIFDESARAFFAAELKFDNAFCRWPRP